MRKAWKDLSPAYRARLEARGVTSHTHGVADLRAARGHKSPPVPGSLDATLSDRVAKGEATYDELKSLGSQFTRPSWIPSYASVDVAGALSRLPNPKRWEDVRLVPRGDGDAWTMIVSLKGNAYDREILIPGGGGPGSGAKQVLQILTDLRSDSHEADRRRRKRIEEIFFEVMGSDEEET